MARRSRAATLRKASDEPLHAGDSDRAPVHIDDRGLLVEHPDPALVERLHELVAAVPVPVVIPEHCEDGRVQLLDGLDERGRLVGLAVQRQVAREQDQPGLTRSVREDRGEPLVSRPARVHVPSCRNPDHHCTVPRNGSRGNHASWRNSTICSRP